MLDVEFFCFSVKINEIKIAGVLSLKCTSTTGLDRDSSAPLDLSIRVKLLIYYFAITGLVTELTGWRFAFLVLSELFPDDLSHW